MGKAGHREMGTAQMDCISMVKADCAGVPVYGKGRGRRESVQVKARERDLKMLLGLPSRWRNGATSTGIQVGSGSWKGEKWVFSEDPEHPSCPHLDSEPSGSSGVQNYKVTNFIVLSYELCGNPI